MPQVVHLDPLALEIQQILDKHLQSDVKTVNSSQDNKKDNLMNRWVLLFVMSSIVSLTDLVVDKIYSEDPSLVSYVLALNIVAATFYWKDKQEFKCQQ